MFAPQSPWRSKIMAGVLTATLLGPGMALAQEPTAVLTVRLSPQPGGALPSFAIDMALHGDHLQGTIQLQAVDTALEGRHSAIRFTESGLQATFGTQLSRQTEDGSQSLGELTVETRAQEGSPRAGGCSKGADIVVFDILGVEGRASEGQVDLSAFAGQTIRMHSEAADASAVSLLGLDIEPASATEQLRCTPAHLCTTPGPGETLMVRVPWLAPGEELDLVLEISSTSSSGVITQIPIKVKHNV